MAYLSATRPSGEQAMQIGLLPVIAPGTLLRFDLSYDAALHKVTAQMMDESRTLFDRSVGGFVVDFPVGVVLNVFAAEVGGGVAPGSVPLTSDSRVAVAIDNLASDILVPGGYALSAPPMALGSTFDDILSPEENLDFFQRGAMYLTMQGQLVPIPEDGPGGPCTPPPGEATEGEPLSAGCGLRVGDVTGVEDIHLALIEFRGSGAHSTVLSRHRCLDILRILQAGVDPVASLAECIEPYLEAQGADQAYAVAPLDQPLDDPLGFQTRIRLPEGTHVVTVTARDFAGNSAQPVTRSVTVDAHPPLVSVDFPPPAFQTANRQVPVRVSYLDSQTGVDPATLMVSINGVDATPPLPGQSFVEFTIEPGDGLHTLHASIADRAGNTGEAMPVSFTVDTTPPDILIDSPAPGSAVAVTEVPFRIGYVDGGVGVAPVTLRIELDGEDITPPLLEPFQVDFTRTLEDGTHTLAVSIADNLGNAATTGPIVFIVDTQVCVFASSESASPARAASERPCEDRGRMMVLEEVFVEERGSLPVFVWPGDGVEGVSAAWYRSPEGPIVAESGPVSLFGRPQLFVPVLSGSYLVELHVHTGACVEKSTMTWVTVFREGTLVRDGSAGVAGRSQGAARSTPGGAKPRQAPGDSPSRLLDSLVTTQNRFNEAKSCDYFPTGEDCWTCTFTYESHFQASGATNSGTWGSTFERKCLPEGHWGCCSFWSGAPELAALANCCYEKAYQNSGGGEYPLSVSGELSTAFGGGHSEVDLATVRYNSAGKVAKREWYVVKNDDRMTYEFSSTLPYGANIHFIGWATGSLAAIGVPGLESLDETCKQDFLGCTTCIGGATFGNVKGIVMPTGPSTCSYTVADGYWEGPISHSGVGGYKTYAFPAAGPGGGGPEEINPTLFLTAVPEEVCPAEACEEEGLPSMASGRSRQVDVRLAAHETQIEAKILDGAKPGSYRVKIEFESFDPAAGGHAHNDPPLPAEGAEREKLIGKIEGDGKCTVETDASGTGTVENCVKYVAGQLGGKVTIKGWIKTLPEKTATVEVPARVKGLEPLGSALYLLKDQSASVHPDRFWALRSTITHVEDTSLSYGQTYPFAPTIMITDASLPWGGLHDGGGDDTVTAYWKPPHTYHREGTDLDIRTKLGLPGGGGIPAENRKKFVGIVCSQHGFPKLENAGLPNEHYHVYYKAYRPRVFELCEKER
ncbi:MAG: Ig-like domain-containing protein [Nitrospirae bacterium]|nr:Ig-like domain-containing protein [Nitrospirota bacterium]